MLYHVAPRILKWNSWFSEPINVSRGILAGTRKPNSFARIFLYPRAGSLRNNIPSTISATTSIFVGDIAQSVCGKLGVVVDHSVCVARMLYTKLVAANLVVSEKSVAVCSDKSVLATVTSKPAKESIFINASRQARDLGVDAAAGARRAVTIAKGRAAKAKKKTARSCSSQGSLGPWCRY